MRLFAGGVRPGNRPKSNAAVDYQLTRDQGLAAARQIAVMALTAVGITFARVAKASMTDDANEPGRLVDQCARRRRQQRRNQARWGISVATEPQNKEEDGDENQSKTARERPDETEMTIWGWLAQLRPCSPQPGGLSCRDHPRSPSASFDLVPAPLELRM